MIGRRSFFGLIAGAAASPIVAKLPAPLQRQVIRIGAYATAVVTAGNITAINITNGGSGYSSQSVITIHADNSIEIEK